MENDRDLWPLVQQNFEKTRTIKFLLPFTLESAAIPHYLLWIWVQWFSSLETREIMSPFPRATTELKGRIYMYGSKFPDSLNFSGDSLCFIAILPSCKARKKQGWICTSEVFLGRADWRASFSDPLVYCYTGSRDQGNGGLLFECLVPCFDSDFISLSSFVISLSYALIGKVTSAHSAAMAMAKVELYKISCRKRDQIF